MTSEADRVRVLAFTRADGQVVGQVDRQVDGLVNSAGVCTVRPLATGYGASESGRPARR